MGEQTAIAWADHTFNTHWGCTKVLAPNGEPSECDHCYAATLATRFGFADGGANGPELWGKDATRRQLSDKYWRDPLKWDRQHAEAGTLGLTFCSSMADVFEARTDLDPTRARLWDLIEQTPNLIWLLLTKRPEQVNRMVPRRWLPGTETGCTDPDCGEAPLDHAWPSNAWVGTSVGTQRSADLRVPRLLGVPAPVRFLSCEPLLGPVGLNLAGIGWVIVGGESGAGHRPMDLDWARDLRDQCAAAEVPFFFKQVGGSTPAAGGHELDGRFHQVWPAAAGDRGTAVAIAT